MDREAALKKIDQDVKSEKIVVFMKGNADFPRCGFSAQAVEVVKRLGYPFKTYDVLEDEDLWNYLEDYSSWPTFPQVFVGGKFVGGCDIVTEMFQKGELQELAKTACGN
jgi:monothiol glutaredoxin